MTIKTENKIYSDVISIVNNALKFYNFNDWQVMRLYQPTKLTDIKPTIYVSYTNTTYRGWQQRSYSTKNEVFTKTEIQQEELLFQFSALKRRFPTDTIETMNGKDVLKHIKMYLVDIEKGLKELKTLGYNIYQPSEIQNPEFFDDGDNFNFMPFFTVIITTAQSLDSAQNSIDKYTFKTFKGV